MALSDFAYDSLPSTRARHPPSRWQLPFRHRIRLCVAISVVVAVVPLALFYTGAILRPEEPYIISVSLQPSNLPWNAPGWLQDYVHFCRQPDTDETRYLIWKCTDGYCGGVGDRLRGIFSAFYLAIATGRKFRIYSTKHSELQRALHPAYIDWTIMPGQMWMLRPKSHALCGIEEMIALAKSTTVERAVVVTTSAMELYPVYEAAEFAHVFRGDGVAIEPQNWDLLASWAWVVLFHPSPQLQAQIESVKADAQLTSDYVAVHVRRGGHWGDAARHDDALSKFTVCAGVSKHTANVTQIYVASDDEGSKFEFGTVTGARYDPHPPAHIEQYHGRDSELRIWAEFMILREAECIVASCSGFSLWAVASSRDPESAERCWARFDRCAAADVAQSMSGPVPIYSQVSANDPDFGKLRVPVGNVSTRFPCPY